VTLGRGEGFCWHCGHRLSDTDYAREARCAGCQRAVHVCGNCRFYRQGVPNDCLEPIAERVVDKERPNFCDYFSPNPAAPAAQPDADALRKAAENLFR
jgi:hypothetical protein